MGELSIRSGDKIPLTLQINEGITDKYVQAILTDPVGDPLVGSPVALPHLSDGLYTDKSITMPGLTYVTAQYKVFNDVGFLDQADEFGIPLDVFLRRGLDLVESKDASLAGEVSAMELTGTLTEITEISKETSNDIQLLGTITSTSLISTLESEELCATLEADEITKEIGCDLEG